MTVQLIREAHVVYNRKNTPSYKLDQELTASNQSGLLKAAAGRLTLEGQSAPLSGPRLFNYINHNLEKCESPGIKAALKLYLAARSPDIEITQQDLSDYKMLSTTTEQIKESVQRTGYFDIDKVRKYIGDGNKTHATVNDAIRLINLIDKVKSTADQKQDTFDNKNGYMQVNGYYGNNYLNNSGYLTIIATN